MPRRARRLLVYALLASLAGLTWYAWSAHEAWRAKGAGEQAAGGGEDGAGWGRGRPKRKAGWEVRSRRAERRGPREVFQSEPLRDLALSPDGRWVVLPWRVFDLATDRERADPAKWLVALRPGRLGGTAFTQDGRRALSAGSRPTLLLWELGAGREVVQLDDGDTATSVALSPDGRFALAGYALGHLVLWDLATRKPARTFGEKLQLPAEDRTVSRIIFLGDSRRALVACDGFSLRLWDVRTGVALRSFAGFEYQSLLAVSPDGRLALTGERARPDGEVGDLRVWEIATGKLLRTLEGHRRSLLGGAFLPGGRGILCCAVDGTIRRWDLRTGEEVWSLRVSTPEHPTTAVAFAADGSLAVTGSEYGGVKVWDLKKRVCRRTPAERSPDAREPEVQEGVRGWLKSPDAEARRRAVELLGDPAYLTFALQDPDPRVRRQAAAALGKGSPDDADWALGDARRDADGEVRVWAAVALYGLHCEEVEYLPVLKRAAKDPAARVRRAAAEGLSQIGAAGAETLGELLKDPDARVRRAAAEGFKDLPIWGITPPRSLVEALRSPDFVVRVLVGRTLWDRVRAGAEPLGEVLGKGDVSLRREAALCLSSFARADREALRPALPTLRAALRDGDGAVRTYAASALARAGETTPAVLRTFTERLEDLIAQGVAGEELGELGPKAAPAVPALLKALRERPRARVHARNALFRIGEAAVPGLVEILRSSEDLEVREHAETALSLMGEPAAPALAKLLRSRDWEVRWRATAVLWHMGPKGRAAAPALRATLKEIKGKVIWDRFAAETLDHITTPSYPD